MIHPTALIDPAAELAADVSVGPFVVIGAGARVGEGCEIEAHAQVLAGVTLADNVRIGRGAIIGGDPQDLKFDRATESSVEIGARTVIREHVTIHRGSKPGSVTRIGCDNFLMVGVHLGHDVQLGDHNALANNVLLAGHVTMGDRCFIGGGSGLHQFIRIGDYCITQGASAISKDLPPFTLAARLNQLVGLNVVGLKRNGFSPEDRAQIKRAFNLFYRSGHNFSQAMALLDQDQSGGWGTAAEHFIDFFREPGPKGICGFRSGRD